MAVLCLPEDMGTVFAVTLLQELREQSTDITLNAGSVKRLGGRCFEVLLSAQKTAHARQSRFLIQNPSAKFTQALETMGGTFLLEEGDTP